MGKGATLVSVCDGCGALASDRHIRERIERLELASRFRPVHIQVLLVDAAPPPQMEDYFYRVAKSRDSRSAESVCYFDQLMKAAEVATGPEIQQEAALANFQRRGFFMASARECPLEGSDIAVARVFPTLLKRIELSYRPKRVAFLSVESLELVLRFQASGWGEQLILDAGKPFQVGTHGRVAPFGDRLALALRQMS